MITLRKRPYDINWSGNQIVYSFFSEEAKHDGDLVFEVRLYFKNNEDLFSFKEIATIPLTPVDGEASIDVSELLRSELEFSLPEISVDPSDARKQTGSFYIEYREYDINNNSNESWVSTESEFVRKVIKGGIAPFLWKGNNYWINYYPAAKPFLTWQRSGRFAAINERLFLAWLNLTDINIGNIKYHIKAFYTDGTDFEVVKTLPVLKDRVGFIPCGAMESGIIAEGKTIHYWQVGVFDHSSSSPGLISQWFQCVNDQRNDYNQQTLHYRNSLGGIDSVRIRGVIETSITLDGGDAETIEPFTDGATVLPRLDRSIPHREQQSFKGDIGHLDKQDQDRLRDAFLSREVWMERYGRWWPVKLLTKQYKLRSSTDKRFAMPIDWMIADGGSYYFTPDMDLGDGILINNVCSAVVTNINHTITYGAGNTLGIVSYTFNVYDPDGVNVNKVQWRIPGFVEEWTDFTYPYTSQLQTNSAVPREFVIYFRALCPLGQPGPVSSHAVIVAAVPNEEEPPPPPPTYNSNLYNETPVGTPFVVQVNGTTVNNGYLSGTGMYSSFFLANQSNVQVVITLPFVTPSQATLESGGLTFYGEITANKVTFKNATIVNGAIIKFK